MEGRRGGNGGKGGKDCGVFEKTYFGSKRKLGKFGSKQKIICRSHQKHGRSYKKKKIQLEYSKKCKDAIHWGQGSFNREQHE